MLGDRQRPELPPQERLAVGIEAAASLLGFRVPSEEYARQVMGLLLNLQPVTSIKHIVYWQVDRLLQKLGVTSLEQLGFTGDRDLGGVVLWNPDGGSHSGDTPIPHKISFVTTDMESGRATVGDLVPAIECHIATVPVGTTALTFPDHTRTIGPRVVSSTRGQIFLASTVTPR